ncbi:dTDP-4-dehydrorhamnose reductase [Sulfuriroseicoccus oceanibius]|uniref:dTDP-4-dehydrorhamnose reductase n=1 Tax=Sulfuriroseicoccus oceanibius TaxID=2707525 RepID=A0A6B3L7U8_9BACT|nr:dTDP-4-dehydrorhamnose reductase [Sulfuriroseicoccus oceanibius]QQL45322.1 dTDP-4-dehydrorhamnose reductase [Sulfuriroseicoccus oceanibius]
MAETKHIIVVGAHGRIGSALVRRYSANPDYQVTGIGRDSLDLSNPASIDHALAGLDFDLLINAAALTNVDYCEQHPGEAQSANCSGPKQLAEICAERGARMIHISTDYVFGGDTPGMRSEDDATAPTGVYGQSKLDGEHAVLEVLGTAGLVVRTSWVFGPDRPSFPDMILQRAQENDVLEAIGDKWSCPCYSEDFAEYLELLFQQKDAHGVFHLCNSGACSWSEYAQQVVDIATDLGIALRCHSVTPTKLADMDRFVAPRPVHTAMATVKFHAATGCAPRDWQSALRDYLTAKVSD